MIAVEGGTVSSEGGTYDDGTEITVTATPAEGYEFILDAQSGGFVFADDKYNLTHAVLDELRKNTIENQND